MNIFQYADAKELGQAAATQAIESIQQTIATQGHANIILATGASQFEMLVHLVQAETIDWGKVTGFHLDEYVEISQEHPASFRRYLQERFVDHVSGLAAFHFLAGDADDPQQECLRVGQILQAHPIDVALIGIGENGHLAFNDPPADVETKEAFIVVELDEACRKQQLGEGWFPSLNAVPTHAISMSMHQILASKELIVSVPDARKAEAVQHAVQGPITPDCPASYLQTHANCSLFLDDASASLLDATH